MQFANAAEKAAYYREKKKNRLKANKLKYYHKNSEIINTQRSAQKNGNVHVSNSAIRKQKSRANLSMKKENNRQYQETFRKKHKDSPGKHIHVFRNRMEKCRLLKKIKEVVPGTPKTQKKILCSVVKTNTPICSHSSNNSVNEMIVSNVKDMVTNLKRRRSDEARAALNILTSSVSGENLHETKSKGRTARSLGLRRHRVSGGYVQRNVFFRSEKACFTATSRKVRSDKISDSTKRQIYDWWVSSVSSRPTGNKADIKRLRTGYKTYMSHPIHIMEKSQTEIYEEFKTAHSEIKISQRYFERLRPFFVLPLRPKDRHTCCCRKHVEARLLYKKCMEFNRRTGRSHLLYDHLSDVVSTTLCQKPDGSQFHRIDCIRRTCPDCGVDKSPLFTESLPNDVDSLIWDRYEYVRVAVKSNCEKKKLMLIQKKTSPSEMFEYFKQVLHTYTEHQFSALWQQEQLSALKNSLPVNHCLVIHDFSENYRCIEKQELQSTYFGKTEVSIHVSVIYRHAVLEYDQIDENTVVLELFYTISPDTTHDHYFVSKVQDEIKGYLDQIGCTVDVMNEYTDGCSSQYKSKTCMGVEYVRVAVKSNCEKKKLMLIQKKTSPSEMFEYFKQVLHTYTEHQFSALWQQEQLSALKNSLPVNHCLVIHDFSENYRCIEKQELQSTYFGKTEVSIHVSVIYRHAVLEYDQIDENTVVSELFYTISPDTTHDHYFVSKVQDEIKGYLDQIGCTVDVMNEYTDGCSSQYKSKTCMGVSSFICQRHGYNMFIRNFFETSHAKGPQDAAGGLLKRQLDIAVMKGNSIQGARDVFDYAIGNLSTPKTGIYQRRIFTYVETIDRTISYSFNSVPNNRRVHQLSTTVPGTIKVRQQSCYTCDNCLAGSSPCENAEMTGQLVVVNMLKTSEGGTVEETPEDEASVSDIVRSGDIVAVVADDDIEDYYLMKVTHEAEILTEDADDQWGNHFVEGTSVIQGLYFDRKKNTRRTYKLIRKKRAIVHSAAVVYILNNSQDSEIFVSETDHLDIVYTSMALMD